MRVSRQSVTIGRNQDMDFIQELQEHRHVLRASLMQMVGLVLEVMQQELVGGGWANQVENYHVYVEMNKQENVKTSCKK